jgi:Zn-dependent protease with chaperone function
MLFALSLVLHFCAAAALTYGIDRLALIPWRKARAAHWTERARLLWPARQANGLLLLAVPASLAALHLSLFPEVALGYPLTAVADVLGAALGMWPMARAVFPGLPLTGWLRDIAAAFVIRLMVLCVFVAGGIGMPSHLNLKAIGLTAGAVVFTLWLFWGGLVWLLRGAGLLVAPPPRLADVVSDMAAQMELPLPRVWLLRSCRANAMALAVTHTLLVTQGALDALSDEELGAICAHEFAHLNEPRRVILARILGSFALLPIMFFKPAIEAWQLTGYVGICVAMVVFSRLANAFRRRMETAADSVATLHEGPAPGTYARTLERLYQINQIPAVLKGTRTHPDLYDRLLASGVTPSYPRPTAPARISWPQGVAILLLAAAAFGAFIRIGLRDPIKRDAAPAQEQKKQDH